jgi:hypothetical protein
MLKAPLAMLNSTNHKRPAQQISQTPQSAKDRLGQLRPNPIKPNRAKVSVTCFVRSGHDSLHSPADYLGAVPVDLAQPLVPRRRNLAPIVVVDGLNGRACYEAVMVFVGCSIPRNNCPVYEDISYLT